MALVSCEYLFWSWHESIFKICCLKSGFYQWQDLGLFLLFLKFWKNGQLWRTLVTKPLDLHGLMGYHMKDNIHIFHLVPNKSVSDHWNCYRKVQEKVAWSCEHQKVDLSPVLSYSTLQLKYINLTKEGTEKKWTALFKHLLFCHYKAYIDLLCTKSMEI